MELKVIISRTEKKKIYNMILSKKHLTVSGKYKIKLILIQSKMNSKRPESDIIKLKTQVNISLFVFIIIAFTIVVFAYNISILLI